MAHSTVSGCLHCAAELLLMLSPPLLRHTAPFALSAGWGVGHCETGADDERFRWQMPPGCSHQHDGCQAQGKGGRGFAGNGGRGFLRWCHAGTAGRRLKYEVAFAFAKACSSQTANVSAIKHSPNAAVTPNLGNAVWASASAADRERRSACHKAQKSADLLRSDTGAILLFPHPI